MQLTNGEPVTSYGVSRDGRRIAWATRSGIYEGETDGGDQRLLVKQPASSLDWSADGERILFASSVPGCCSETKRIYVVVVSTGLVTRLTPEKVSEGNPVWRPR